MNSFEAPVTFKNFKIHTSSVTTTRNPLAAAPRGGTQAKLDLIWLTLLTLSTRNQLRFCNMHACTRAHMHACPHTRTTTTTYYIHQILHTSNTTKTNHTAHTYIYHVHYTPMYHRYITGLTDASYYTWTHTQHIAHSTCNTLHRYITDISHTTKMHHIPCRHTQHIYHTADITWHTPDTPHRHSTDVSHTTQTQYSTSYTDKADTTGTTDNISHKIITHTLHIIHNIPHNIIHVHYTLYTMLHTTEYTYITHYRPCYTQQNIHTLHIIHHVTYN